MDYQAVQVNVQAIADAEQAHGKRIRFYAIDMLRGFALLNMIIFHALWDIASLITKPWGVSIATFMSSQAAYVWQQAIGICFIFLAGFCWRLGRKPLRRGIELIAWGEVISLVTTAVIPHDSVHFGVLTLIGFGTLILWLIDIPAKFARMHTGEKAMPVSFSSHGSHWIHVILATISMILFVLFHDAQTHSIWSLTLPQWLYANNFTTLLGFPFDGFISSDYYPLIPWLFVMFTGYFLFNVVHARAVANWINTHTHKVSWISRSLEFLGRHSLVIYLTHQVILFAIIWLISLI
ncbi:heparan-alpha-glucosaminide N-acetyltransferase domain-containing protein [Alloscardovia venturai]|uniref:Heparan-alpha-glucosaminide N-acetyltransferase domain-containing protein n=1 Tax=Alloscardovia venturai TaxID=1769421 RepID=A0ABW2YBV2_9BIFI